MNYKRKLELLSIYLSYYNHKKSTFCNHLYDITDLIKEMDFEEKSYIRNIHGKWFKNFLTLEETIEIEESKINNILNRLKKIKLLKNDNN